VEVSVSGGRDIGPSETMSQIFSHRNAKTIQHFRQSTALTITLDRKLVFSTRGFCIDFQGLRSFYETSIDPQALPQFASKIVEVVGGDGITSLVIEMMNLNPSDEMWETFFAWVSSANKSATDRKGRKGIKIWPTPSFWFSLDHLKGGRFAPSCGIWNCPGGC
jgi:hypothetical protein